MTRTSVALDLRIHFRTNMHIGSGFGKGKWLDDLMVQGPHPEVDIDLPYIPGSTLKGRISERAPGLAAPLGLDASQYAEAHERLFGSASRPGPLTFRNAHLERSAAAAIASARFPAGIPVLQHDRAFVSLSRMRRVALEGRLFRVNVADAGLQFVTRIHGTLPNDSMNHDLTLLAAACRLVTHIGGHRSRGLGHCQVMIESSEPNVDAFTAWLEAS